MQIDDHDRQEGHADTPGQCQSGTPLWHAFRRMSVGFHGHSTGGFWETKLEVGRAFIRATRACMGAGLFTLDSLLKTAVR
jgi:hypothetical protein